MAEPLITVYRPVRRGDRWVARADVNARGELIELQATASDKLASQARGWYNHAAQWLGRFVRYQGGHEPRIEAKPGTGVFAELPQIGYELVQKIPHDEDVSAAAQLMREAINGHPEAIDRLQQASLAADLGDPQAVDAMETVKLLEAASQRDPDYPTASILLAAGAGDESARKAVAAIRETTAGGPTRLCWHVDDYMHEPGALCHDVACACVDEISARILDPAIASFGQVRHVRRGYDHPMLYTFRLIQARYGG